MIRWLQLFGAMALIYVLLPSLAHAERIKDMATVSGVRTNQVIGYGLVVGLNGTGDQTTQAPFTIQSISNMLANFGLPVPASVASQMQLKNVAAVTVTAELPPFVKAGQTIDITVASIANATSLRGGALLMTPLHGADGEVYAVAQGSVMVSGFGVAGKDGSRVSVNRARSAQYLRQPAVRHAQSELPRFHQCLAADRGAEQDAGRGQRAGSRFRLGQSQGADD
jgi:flagellar P-ring protein precursor FlgI